MEDLQFIVSGSTPELEGEPQYVNPTVTQLYQRPHIIETIHSYTLPM